jgi:8-oxo-dGTP pyrophosphatase MutT (NUDIX family)
MGKMELGETPSECAIRETREEPGILVEVTGILGIFSDPGHVVQYGDGEIRQEYEVILLARPVSGEPSVNEEASDVGWVAPGDLQSFDIHPTKWRQLNHYLDGTYPAH